MNVSPLKIGVASQNARRCLIVSLTVLLLLNLCSNTAIAQGVLANGALYQGNIAITNQVDTWSFTANAGDSVVVRVGTLTSTNTFNPWLRVYGPAGTLLGSDDPGDLNAAEIALTATNSGTYTVVVSDGSYPGSGADGGYGGTGTYQLNYVDAPQSIVVSPGDEGGPMTNGALYVGTISAGDLDAWSFTANAGDSVVVREGKLTGTTTFNPWLRVYGPAGNLLDTDDPGDLNAAEIALTATNSGKYTVVVSDGSNGGDAYGEGYDGTGTYQLNYVDAPQSIVVSPGDEGGPMTNGALYVGTISAGDLDAWSFTANAGDSVVVREGKLTGTTTFNPWLRVYGPAGNLLDTDDPGDLNAAEIALTATNSGKYTVVVSDGSNGGDAYGGGYDGTGTYQLNYVDAPQSIVVSPGDEGGPMTNGALYVGTISAGDLDAWSFTANAGDSVVVRVGKLTGTTTFNPWLRVYGPAGNLLDTDDPGTANGAEIALTATNSGKYTAVVSDGSNGGDAYGGGYDGTGTYQLNYFGWPGNFVTSPGDQGGPLSGATKYYGTITSGDLDPWSFTACQGDLINLQLNTTNFNGYLALYGPNGALLNTAGGGTVSRIAYTATNCGPFLVLISSYSAGGAGTYGLTANGLSYGFKTCSPLISGTVLNVNGVGGTPGTNAVLFTTTNIANPALWTPIRTNAFDQFGVFQYTNGFNPAEPKRFFRLSHP